MEDLLKNVWPDWRIVRILGKGSYGTVYEAERNDSFTGAKAAIKVISVPQDRGEIDSLRSEGMTEENAKVFFRNAIDSFIKEIEIMESFKGTQNIVSVEDYKVIEKTDGIGWDIYIRMELLTPFNAYITDRVMSESEIVNLGIDMCTALELCAKKNIIHRDIKPENIFINAFGNYKLGDFGIARKLENVSGGLSYKGTYNYMAPEVERGNEYDATVDIYSLGLVLYRLANNNRMPFLSAADQMNPNARQEAVRRRMSGEPLPAPSGVSYDLAQIILTACRYDPAERFASASAMKNALRSVNVRPVRQGVPVSTEVSAAPGAMAAAAGRAPVDPDATYSVRRAGGQSAQGQYRGEPNQYQSAQSRVQMVNDRVPDIPERQHYTQTMQETSSGNDGSKAKTIIIPIIAGVVALAAVAVALIVIFTNTNKDRKDDRSASEDNMATEELIQAETETTIPPITAAQSETQPAETLPPESAAVPETTAPLTTELATGSNSETPAANAQMNAQEPSQTASQQVPVTIEVPSLRPGDVIQLGSYEQDNNLNNGAEPIEWIMLYEEEGNYMLLSKYALDAKPYDQSGKCSSWEDCSLRSWLNGSFYDSAFSAAEKKIIQTSKSLNDNVFLLGYNSSGESGVTYFLKSDSARACYATSYAIANGAWVTKDNGHSPWWLRNIDGSNAYMVKSTGEIGSNVMTNGAIAEDIEGHTLVTIRPAIWITGH